MFGCRYSGMLTGILVAFAAGIVFGIFMPCAVSIGVALLVCVLAFFIASGKFF